MLSRYQIIRGKRPLHSPLPEGRRVDIRAHVGHALSPDTKSVRAVLDDGSDAAFRRYAEHYTAALAARFARDRAPFDALAAWAEHENVYLGCNCPTKKNPDVSRCHTVLALKFMRKKYPKLRVVMPRKGA
jgi:hypothetical protein